MAVRDITGARCLITGASSGIGRALALELARQGARLVVTARRSDRLESLADEIRHAGWGEVLPVVGDLTEPSFRETLREVIAERWQSLDLLVNNAGSGAYGPFLEGDEARLRRVFEIDFFAPVELTRVCFPWLQRGNKPLVVNIGSVLGHRAVPYKSEYCAAKFALHGWSDSVRAEWARLGVDVLLVSPSTTRSEFFERVEVSDGKTRPRAGARGGRAMSPSEVARRAVRAMRRGDHEVILSVGGKLLVWGDRLCPTLMNHLLARTNRQDEPPSGNVRDS